MNNYFALAERASRELGVPPEWLYAQWQHETGDFTSPVFREYGNAAGIKNYPAMDDYENYKNPDDFVNAYVSLLKKYDGVPGAKTLEGFVGALKNGGYFEDSFDNYYNGMQRFLGGEQKVNNGNYSVASTGVVDPRTNKTAFIPIPVLPQKTYENILPPDFIEKAMGIQMGNPKLAAQQAIERSIPAIMQAYTGSNSPEAIQQMLPIMQSLSQGDISAAETDVNIQNDAMKRQALGQMLGYLPKMQNPQEQAALMGAIETMGGKAPDALKYSYDTPDKINELNATIATGNANRGVEWQKIVWEKEYKDKYLKLTELELGAKLFELSRKSSAGTLSPDDANGIMKIKDSLITAHQMTGDNELFMSRFLPYITMVAKFESGGRDLTPDELAQYITKSFPGVVLKPKVVPGQNDWRDGTPPAPNYSSPPSSITAPQNNNAPQYVKDTRAGISNFFTPSGKPVNDTSKYIWR